MKFSAYKAFGFESCGEYLHGLKTLPKLLATRAFAPVMPANPVKESGAAMKQVLNAFDLVCLGIGMMLGAGVFVTTGYVTANLAGPGVIISYIVAGICAMLSSFCYAEFAVDIPAAGGAYTYIAAALGEFLAWLAVANLIFEYILANAAAIRGFSPYFAALTNKTEDFYIHFWTAPNGSEYHLDWWAFGWCTVLAILLIFGTRESAWFNGVVTVLHVVLVIFIIIAGLVKAKPSNTVPFFPFGVRGAFNGASIVFFSYIGFDAVACAAEETKNPRRDLPIGILGAVACVTVLYTLMAATLALMVPRTELLAFSKASFANAFNYVGMHWATYIVAVGALMGIITTTLVGMYGTSRIITGVARDHLIPPFLAHVGGRMKTPWVAIAIQGIVSAVLALFSSFDELADMVSISTLFAFWVVALGLVWRRSCTDGVGGGGHLPGLSHTDDSTDGPTAKPASTPMAPGALLKRRLLTAGLLLLINGGALTFTLGWVLSEPGDLKETVMLAVGGGVFLIATALLHILVKPMYTPTRYVAPFYPWLPAFSMAFNLFLLGQLGKLAYERFGIWTACCIAMYLLYSSISSNNKRSKDGESLPVGVQATDLSADKQVQMS